ncbi:MAG: hypothetical protein CSA70_03600 [Rhodobacterales bacterium]|nr:MAG: hypothetical protein CSA70_03600 [Rhodobacterales bacterium]
MLKQAAASPLRKIMDFILFDEVRLLELFSALSLLAWAKVLLTGPDTLTLARGFGPIEATVSAYFFGAIVLLQTWTMFDRSRHRLDLRFAAMALSSGAWTVIAWELWRAGMPPTVNLNYSMLAAACAASGIWLGWKSTSYLS